MFAPDEAPHALAQFVTRFNAWPCSLGQLHLRKSPADLTAIAQAPADRLLRSYFQWIDFPGRPMIGGDFMLQLYGPGDLLRAQNGWQVTGNEDPAWGWKPGFTVFADRHGDVLVYDRLNEHSAIFGSIQMRSFKVAANILALIGALEAGIAVELDEFEGATREDDDSHVPGFLARVREVVGDVDGADVDGFMKFFFE
ncbi:hypothetical protein [Pseudomonas sp. KNUC1026]|uniref:hypothetical protein n=1 Tax=Pseudomonas sp. KNUC1026 TaxID=2893890 RepID=UPI001F361947|nr:hypothetical protein [Pseudomonas sp. KNUC1026]UFH50507.1 hypothetical protein LN139_04505 [Pseudomonas sp. KNUC1026]